VPSEAGDPHHHAAQTVRGSICCSGVRDEAHRFSRSPITAGKAVEEDDGVGGWDSVRGPGGAPAQGAGHATSDLAGAAEAGQRRGDHRGPRELASQTANGGCLRRLGVPARFPARPRPGLSADDHTRGIGR